MNEETQEWRIEYTYPYLERTGATAWTSPAESKDEALAKMGRDTEYYGRVVRIQCRSVVREEWVDVGGV